MTLLTIVQNAAVELGLSKPSTVIGNTDPTAERLLSHCRYTGLELAKKPWTVLTLEHTFTTTTAEAYDLPSDFADVVDGTIWNRTDFEQAKGPLTPQEWQEFKSGLIGSIGIQPRYRFRPVSGVKKFSIENPVSGENLVYEYYSNAWVNNGGSLVSDWVADTDTCVLDEELMELGTIYRALRRAGMANEQDKKDYENAVDIRLGRDGGSKEIDLVAPDLPRFAAVTPQTGFG